jgi:hypothetical protein
MDKHYIKIPYGLMTVQKEFPKNMYSLRRYYEMPTEVAILSLGVIFVKIASFGI